MISLLKDLLSTCILNHVGNWDEHNLDVWKEVEKEEYDCAEPHGLL